MNQSVNSESQFTVQIESQSSHNAEKINFNFFNNVKSSFTSCISTNHYFSSFQTLNKIYGEK